MNTGVYTGREPNQNIIISHMTNNLIFQFDFILILFVCFMQNLIIDDYGEINLWSNGQKFCI